MRNNLNTPFASLEKAIGILSLFDFESQALSAREISKKVNIPLSTTYKYLDIFLKKGFLSKDVANKTFYVGLTIFKMGVLAAEKISLYDVAFPFMKSLNKQSGETVILTVIHDMEALCVDVIESPRMVRLTIKKGTTLPLHAGASEKILLAYQDESFIDAVNENKGLVKFNKNTITDPEQLKRELKLIRSRGFTQSDAEIDLEAAAIASPIFDQKGKVVAGLTAAGPKDRILGKKRHDLVNMVIETARKISNELGYVKVQGKALVVETL